MRGKTIIPVEIRSSTPSDTLYSTVDWRGGRELFVTFNSHTCHNYLTVQQITLSPRLFIQECKLTRKSTRICDYKLKVAGFAREVPTGVSQITCRSEFILKGLLSGVDQLNLTVFGGL